MNLVIKGDGTFLLPPNQLYTFEHNGRKIHCSVDLLIEDYKDKQAELVNVNEVFKPENIVNTEYAMKADVTNPIIIVRFNDGTHEILDGNHRLYRVVHEGQSYIRAHVLNELELNKYII